MNSPAGPPDPDDPTVPSPAAGSSDSVTGEYNHDGTAPEVDNQDDTAAGSGIEDEEESSNHDSYNSGVDNDADGDVDEEHDDRGWGEDCGSPTCVAARTIMENQLETKNQEIQRLTALLRQKPKFKPKPQQRHKRVCLSISRGTASMLTYSRLGLGSSGSFSLVNRQTWVNTGRYIAFGKS